MCFFDLLQKTMQTRKSSKGPSGLDLFFRGVNITILFLRLELKHCDCLHENVFAIICRQEILYARRELNDENLALEKLVMNAPVNISQTFLCCNVGQAFLF